MKKGRIINLFNTEIDVFFRNPHSAPEATYNFSRLYLLRRDIDVCFGIDPNTGNPLHDNCPKALWPGVMCILAGVDLLGKFYAGNDKQGEVGKRFKDFLMRYFVLSDNDAETIYQLRNVLLHSFGLYCKKGNGTVYQFELSSNRTNLLSSSSSTDHVVNINILYDNFQKAVTSYHNDLLNDGSAQLRENFFAMIKTHNLVGIK